MLSRRGFTKTFAASAAGLAVATSARTSAASYARILGANSRVNCAVIGLNGRAGAHLSSLQANRANAAITHVADVDSTILARFAASTEKTTGSKPQQVKDFRHILDNHDVDAITIATPDHWHTPMAILGMAAGKDVYVEKPCSQNVHETELIVAAQKKYGKVLQMGNQQRSSPHSIDIIHQVQNGLLGRTYYAKAWYTNSRGPIGIGKVVPVPATLDWDLWQGPAPRTEYKNNIHPYNWHWFHRWGTGETLNNGTHEVDLARWCLQVDFPDRISVGGGRYVHHDDWEFYDTLNVSFEYPDKLIEWECRCSNDMPIYNRERGVAYYGETGTVILDRDGWEHHDLKGKLINEYKMPKDKQTTSADTVGRDSMTDLHFGNWLAAIQSGAKLDSPIQDARISVAILLMANIAYDVKQDLKLDAKTSAFLNNPEATAKRARTYEKGWEPKV